MKDKQSFFDLAKGDSLFVVTELSWFENYCATSVGQFSIKAEVENTTPKFLDISCPLLFGKGSVVRFSKESGREQSASRLMDSRYLSLTGNDESESYTSKNRHLDRLKSLKAFLYRNSHSNDIDWLSVTPKQVDLIYDSINALPRKK